MNRLEDAIRHDLSGAPEPPPVAAIEGRARRRRTREVAAGCGSGVAIVALVIAAFVSTRPSSPVDVRTTSPSTPRTSTATTAPTITTPTLPLATRTIFPGLDRALSEIAGTASADGHVDSAEIVATTHDKTFVLFGGRADDHRATYLVKLVGRFVCNGCSAPARASTPRGDRVYFTMTLAPGALDDPWEIGSRDIDLAAFGRVYRLPPAIATAHLDLGARTLRSGESMSGRVVVENDSGSPLQLYTCGPRFQVVLGNGQHPPRVGWRACREPFVVPVGRSTYPIAVTAADSRCTDVCVFTPGTYRAYVMAADPATPRAPSVPVRVTG